MRKLILLAGVAALAAAVPASAEKGGKGGGHGGGHGAAAEHGKGHGGAGKDPKPAKAQKIERHVSGGHGQKLHVAKPMKAERHAFRNELKRDRIEDRRIDRRAFDDRRFDDRFDEGRRFAGTSCPPGLAKKHNGCMAPGQAKKRLALGSRIERDWFSGSSLPLAYRGFYSDNDSYSYRYDDNGYIYRVDNRSSLISGIIPLLGGGFNVGQPLPSGYDVYNVPYSYRDVYQDNDDRLYRYGDNAIYGVDPQTGIVESIVALLAGNLNVGQPLPDGYDAYNLPYDYRDEYVDNDDYQYRYADGNIYQVDAKTQIIQAIVDMIA
jgi:hypothetical protein